MILWNQSQVEERWEIMELIDLVDGPRTDDEVAVFESIVNKAVPYLVQSISTIQDVKKFVISLQNRFYGRELSISQK